MGMPTMPWLRGTICFSLGTFILIVAALKSFCPPEEDTSSLAVEIEKVRKKASDAETGTAAVRRDNELLVRELQIARTANTQDANRIEKRRAQVLVMEDDNFKRTAALRNDTQKLQAMAHENVKNRNQQLLEQQNQASLQAALTLSSGAVATIGSANGNVASGCLIHNQDRPLVFTVLPADTPVEGLVVKLTLETPNASGKREYIFAAKPVHFDKATSLTVLTFSFTGRVTFNVFQPGSFVDAKAGEKVYMIGTQIMGDQLMEKNIYEGSVSAIDREIGNVKYIQLAIPGNFGTKGAPLFNTGRQLIGILKGPLEGLERTSIAIPASEVLRVHRTLK